MPRRREGETPKKVYSIRLEEKDFKRIIKEHGSLSSFIKKAVSGNLSAEDVGYVLDCPHCGTSELLCGYPNNCCAGN